MKKSVVAAVAASNLTVFSGLVNAQDQEGSGCKMIKVAGEDGVCKQWNDKDWYNYEGEGQLIFGCIVYCDPANNDPNGGQGSGRFLVWCTPDHVPVNNGWYGGSIGCDAPTDHTQPVNPAE